MDGADGVDGQVMLELAAEHGLEGVVAKRLSSRYRCRRFLKSRPLGVPEN